jgi:hypothetical protein
MLESRYGRRVLERNATRQVRDHVVHNTSDAAVVICALRAL